MSNKRYAARSDANQTDIVKKLRKMGVSVQLGHDDALIGYNGKTYWFEIKDPEKTLKKNGDYKAGAIKPSQIKLKAEWRGHYSIVHSFEQIIDEIMGSE